MSKHSSTSWHLSTDQSEELLDKLKSQLPYFTELTSLLQPLASWGGGGGGGENLHFKWIGCS